METEFRKRIDPTEIPPDVLTRFRKLAIDGILPVAPAFRNG